MEESKPRSSRKAEAARKNGRKGGTKNPDVSRWNSLKSGVYAKKLFSCLREFRHRPEYPPALELATALLERLGPPDILHVEDVLIVERVAVAKLVWDRAHRFYITQTERNENGLTWAGMDRLERHLQIANHRLDCAYNDFEALRKGKPKSIALDRELHSLGQKPPRQRHLSDGVTPAAEASPRAHAPEIRPNQAEATNAQSDPAAATASDGVTAEPVDAPGERRTTADSSTTPPGTAAADAGEGSPG